MIPEADTRAFVRAIGALKPSVICRVSETRVNRVGSSVGSVTSRESEDELRPGKGEITL